MLYIKNIQTINIQTINYYQFYILYILNGIYTNYKLLSIKCYI